jgi:hypothetical protein
MIPLKEAKVLLRAHVYDFKNGVDIAAFVDPWPNSIASKAVETVFVQVVECGQETEPPILMSLSSAQAQLLMNDLWQGGMRPDGWVATDKRLEKLEQVVQSLAKVTVGEMHTDQEWERKRRAKEARDEDWRKLQAEVRQRQSNSLDEYPPPLTTDEAAALQRAGLCMKPLEIDTSMLKKQLLAEQALAHATPGGIIKVTPDGQRTYIPGKEEKK